MQLAVVITLVAAVLLAAAAATSEAQQAATQDLNLTGAWSDDDSFHVIKRASTIVGEQFSLSQAGKRGYTASYRAFMADMDFHVSATAARSIQHHPVLGQQQLRDPPATLFNVTITADPDAKVSFFLRSDNLYLIGFTNNQGRLFSFKGDKYKLPGSKQLSFGSGYRDFFRKEGHDGLLKLLVNREQAVDHLKILSSYQAAAPDEHLKFPVAFFVLTICEAERFVPIRQAVIKRWEEVASNIDEVLDRRTNTVLLDLVVNWRAFSCALLSWNRHGETPGAWTRIPEARDVFPRFGVTTAQAALSTVNPILQSCPV